MRVRCGRQGYMTPMNRIFSNKYFKNILLGNAFFQSDRALGADSRTRPYVEAFAANNDLFFQNFTCAGSWPSILYAGLDFAGILLRGDAEQIVDCFSTK